MPRACPLCGGAGQLQGVTQWGCGACGYAVPVCFYWKSHGASPGEPTAYDDLLAIELHNQVQAVGVELVRELRSLVLTSDEAELLLARLHWLAQYVAQGAGQAEA